jgi:NAD-dependent deacetylase
MSTPNATITRVAALVQRAERILFITGAGLSADSGLPTYRGVSGLYSNANTAEGYPIEIALSASMFQQKPALTWKYLWQIGAACVGAQPNPAHRWMAQLATAKRDVWVLTQNVDGLHRQAGSTHLVEAHGHAFDLYCTACGKPYAAQALLNNYRGNPSLPPHCPRCAGIVRPNVVLFGEVLPLNVQKGLHRLQQIDFDLVFSIGTSALFPYITYFIERASEQDKPVVEINPQTTEATPLCSHHIRQTAVLACAAIAIA